MREFILQIINYSNSVYTYFVRHDLWSGVVLYFYLSSYLNMTIVDGTRDMEPMRYIMSRAPMYGTSNWHVSEQNPLVALPSAIHPQFEKVCWKCDYKVKQCF